MKKYFLFIDDDNDVAMYDVDNLPPQSELQFIGVVQILEQGLPVHSAIAGSLLEIEFTIGNYGDLDASEISIDLIAPGSSSETYPSEVIVDRLEEGESSQLKLYWWATEAGVHDVTLNINEDDADNSNNQYTFSFIVEETVEKSNMKLTHIRILKLAMSL